MKKNIALAVAAAACALSATAFAQDASPFAGPYVGVQASLNRAQDKHNDLDEWYYNARNAANEDTGVMGGIKAGYDYVAGPAIVGVLAEASFGKIDTINEYTPEEPSYMVGNKIKMLGSVRAKAGVTSGNIAAFVTGGWAFSDNKHRWIETDGSGEVYSGKGSRSGYVIGMGAAYAINGNSSIGVDISRYQFGTRTHEILESDGTPTDYFVSQRDRVDNVAVSYNYSF